MKINDKLIDQVESIDGVMKLFNILSKLSFTPRRGFEIIKLKGESVAAHMYRVLLLALYIKDKYDIQNVNTQKFIIMSIIHDWAESYIGDITPHDNIDINIKHEFENKIIKKICSNNTKLMFSFIKCYKEYSKQKTVTAKFVKLIDKLDFLLAIIQYKNTIKNKKKNSFLTSIYNNVIINIKLHEWGDNQKKYINILETICKQENQYKNLTSLLKLKI